MHGFQPPSRSVAKDSILELIGETPMVRLCRMVEPGMADICVKLEQLNPSSSLKDRVALALLENAERQGSLRAGGMVIEATCGNLGISLALACAVKGYRLTVTLPEFASEELQMLLKAYGATVELTPAHLQLAGAVARAKELVAQTPGSFMPNQHENPINSRSHQMSTGRELVETVLADGGQIDALVMGAGTGGTVMGVARALKEHFPCVRVFAVELAGAGVRQYGLGGADSQPLLDRSLVERTITIQDSAAWAVKERLARDEGMLVGPSSGANVAAALEVARELGSGRRVYTLCCDSGERYFSLAEER
jgi:cysteine synthase A